MRPGNGEGLNVETLAGESREAFRTSDLDKRLLRYGSAKENALKFRRYLVQEREDKLADALGDLVVVDVGGATTDIHSVTDGSPEIAAISTEPQPHAKRTVEGDLGTFVSAEHTAALIAESERPDPLPPAIPFTPAEFEAAALLARAATVTAMTRHAGRLAHLYTPKGRQTVAHGRDLTACRLVIGTGGALVRLPGGEAALRATLGGPGEVLLPPADARVALDRDYVFACCGTLLAHFEAGAVVSLACALMLLGVAWRRS